MSSSYDYLDASARPGNFQLNDATCADFSTPTTVFANDVTEGYGNLGHYGNANHESGNHTIINTAQAIDDRADDAIERSVPSPTRTPQNTTRRENTKDSALSTDPSNAFDYATVTRTMKCRTLDQKEKLYILQDMPENELNKLYNECIAAYGLEPPYMASTTTTTAPSAIEDINESNYRPLNPDDEAPSPDPNAPPPLYPAYTGHFRTAQDAKRHRQRTRVAPKSKAPDIERVRRYGRPYWVRRIYEAMIDITDMSDGDSSIHRQRFVDDTAFDPLDLEAAAHHVFDSALAVHERGWNRPLVYHKRVVRGKLTDVSEKSLERRLTRLCLCLKHKKATVDDALRGGITLALLCDNPEARGFTKTSNNTGNKKRGERLKRAKGSETQQEPGEDEGEEEE